MTKEQLISFLLDSNLVSKTDIDEAFKLSEEQGLDISEVLIKSGKISEDDYRRIQALVLGVPYVDLKDYKVDIEILSIIPEPVARNNNIVAFAKKDEALEVAMLDINDLSTIDFIKKKSNLKILPRLTDVNSIKTVLMQYQKSLKAEFGDIIKNEISAIKPTEDLKKMAEDLPVVRVVDTLLKHAVLQNASDIHIEMQEKDLIIRYRIDGLLHDAMILPINVGSSITARIKVLSNLKLDEKRLPQDGRFKINLGGENVSFRVSLLPTYYGEKTVMRILRENVSGFTLEFLGFQGKALEELHRATTLTTGMVLTTGPTGSGKTTTLYTLLDIVNTPDVNISTIEDPIEYQMKRINQTQVKPDIGLTFASGLRSLVRQDPDIIMVGEIRDTETASLAVNASLTGHLVFSTLHTNSAAGAIPRLIDMKIEPFLLVSTINLIIGQRLVRKLNNSKESYILSEDERKTLSKVVDLNRVLTVLKSENIVEENADWNSIKLWRDKKKVGESSFSGRIGIYEVLKVTETVRSLIIKGASPKEIEDQAKKEGMITMIEDGIVKSAQGLTSIEEVLRVISE
jgi:type IV pilus assembly protein PilB